MFTEIKDLTNITDEYILFKHNKIKLQIEDALRIVKEYIIKNKLLIVGGMAIDLALQMKNTRLYNPLYEIPDYDIISPNNIEHANNIGKILCNNKFENISIIPAIHHTTVRVQLLGYTVFDSTYVPEYIYNKIPNIKYKEFKFVDPNFQKINQYLSLSFLFKITGPSYNILNRFAKDIERFNLIDQYYNLADKINLDKIKLTNSTSSKFSININNIKISNIQILEKEKGIIFNEQLNNNNAIHIFKLLNKKDISYNINSNIILHGIFAYNVIYNEFELLYSKLIDVINFQPNDLKLINEYYKYIIIKNKIEIDKSDNIIFNYNNLLELCFINTNNSIDKYINILKHNYSINNIKKLDNILDFKPKYIEFIADDHNVKIYDLYGDLVGINLIYIQNIHKFIPISTFTYNLMYFLTNYYFEENEEIKKINLYYYISLKYLIKIIMFINENYKDELSKCYNFTNSCFNFSINSNGIDNFSDNYEYFIQNFKNIVEFNKNLNQLPPKNYIGFPNCNIKNNFELLHSPYYNNFQQEIIETNYSKIIKEK
jgi:hypothetical protein